MSPQDFQKVDLLIIMGTSLQVQPFASLVSRSQPPPKMWHALPPFPQYQLFCVFSSLTCSRFVLQGPCQHPQAPHQQGENRAGEGRGLLEGGGQLPPPASLPLHCPQSDVFMSLMGFGCGMDFDSDKAYRQGLGVGGLGGLWGHRRTWG